MKIILVLCILTLEFLLGWGREKTEEEKKIYKETDMCYTIAFSRTQKKLKYPSTFDVVGIKNKNISKGIYTSELSFTAKNAMGFDAPYTSIHECNFNTDRAKLIKFTTR